MKIDIITRNQVNLLIEEMKRKLLEEIKKDIRNLIKFEFGLEFKSLEHYVNKKLKELKDERK